MNFTPKTYRIIGRIFLIAGAVLGLWSIYNMGVPDNAANIAAPISSLLVTIGIFFAINYKKRNEQK